MEKIAVLGAGIAGLSAAWMLSKKYEVHLFEKNDYLGGHTNTHDVELKGRQYAIDTGFIIFNSKHYPLLTRFFDTLGVKSQLTDMSFSVHNQKTGLQYKASGLGGMFCQTENIFKPSVWRLMWDIARFYRLGPSLLEDPDYNPSLEEYLKQERFGRLFGSDHLLPMASALWSSPLKEIGQFPIQHLVRFMQNHELMSLKHRTPWQVVQGGSSRYVDALTSVWKVKAHCSREVVQVCRKEGEVELVFADHSRARFSQVVLACHPDDALRLLEHPTEQERIVLGDMRYQDNEVVLHTDARILPPNPKAWAAWNAYIPANNDQPCTVSYWMNALQTIDSPEPFIVTLNRTVDIDPQKILKRLHYRHPEYNHASFAAQTLKPSIQGKFGTWYASAGWGFGFHEDGIRSSVEVAKALGVSEE